MGGGWPPHPSTPLHEWGTVTHVSPSSSARVAMAMSADRGCSMEHTMGYRGVGKFSRGKGEPMVGVGYRESKGPGKRKDVHEAKPTGHQPAPPPPGSRPPLPFPLVPFASPPEPSRPETNSSTTSLLCVPVAPLPSPGHCHLSLLLSDPSSSTRQRFCTFAQHGDLRASLLSEFVAEEGKGWMKHQV